MRAWLILLCGLVLGAVAGAGGMLIAFPFLFPLPVVNEAAPVEAGSAVKLLRSFKFDEAAPGRDRIHWANGSGRIIAMGSQTIVRLEDDFESGPGPNYWIYLNTKPVGDEASFLADPGRVKISPLKSFKRGQNFALPDTVRLDDFTTLTIWCESFGAYIASGTLTSAPGQ